MKLHLPVALLAAVVSAMSAAYAANDGITFQKDSVTNDTTVTVTGGNYADFRMGGTAPHYVSKGAIYGASGDGTVSEYVTEYNNVNLNVSGGTGIGYLIGQGEQSGAKVTGDTNITVSGGSVGTIIGGSQYKTSGVYGFNQVGNSTQTLDSKTGGTGATHWAHKDASNPDINIDVTGGTIKQIRGGNNNASEHVYRSIYYALQQDSTGAAYNALMSDKNWSVAGDVNISVGGDAVVGDGTKAIAGAGGSGHSVDGKVTVNVSGGTINGAIYGGSTNIYTEVGSTEVNISGGTINGNVFGGGNYDDGADKASDYGLNPAEGPTVKEGSTVVLSGGTINGSVYAAGIKDTVNGGTNVVIKDGGATVTGIISGKGEGATVNGDRILSIENTGGAGVNWNQIQDFNAVEFKGSEIKFGTLSKDFEKVSAEGSWLQGSFEDGEVQLNANDSWLEIAGDLTTTEGSTITNTREPMTVTGDATFQGTTIENSDLVAGGKMEFDGSTMNGGTISVGSGLILNGNTEVVVDSINNGNSVLLTGGSEQNITLDGDVDLNELLGALGRPGSLDDILQSGNAHSGSPSLTVNSDLKLAAGSSYKGEVDKAANLTANSITTEGAVTFDKADVTATEGDVSLSAGSKVTDSNITSTNGKIALDGITGEGTVTLSASTNGWSTISGDTTVEDLVLESGKLQVKKDATLTADNLTLNGATYIDGQTTANTLTATKDTYVRYNGVNVGELNVDGAAFSVSNGAQVEVGKLTASNDMFGLTISGADTKVVVGKASTDVHEVNNFRLSATDGSQLVVNGTLQGNRISVVGAADFDKVKGDYFRYTNTSEEHDVKVDSIEGYQALLHNLKGDITIGKLVTESGEVKASGDISLSQGTNLTYTQVNSSEGDVTLKGVTIVDSKLTATTGDITISDKSTVDGGSIVVGGALNLTNSNVTVDSLTGADGADAKVNVGVSFNKTYLTVNNDLVLAEGSTIYGGMMYNETVVKADSITGKGVTAHSADLIATEGNLVLSDSKIEWSKDWGNGKSTLTAEKGNVEISNSTLDGTNLVATNGTIALDGVKGLGTLSLTASTSGWSTITGETKLNDLVLESGNLQVKKDATLTADTVTLNGQTYIDGQTIANKIEANNSLNVRVNGLEVGELNLKGGQLSVSHGAEVKVGQLTAEGQYISVSDTTGYGSSQLILGADSNSVHNVANTDISVNGESTLLVNGTLKGDDIFISGVAQIENVEGNSFKFMNTATEGDLKLGSLTGNNARLENKKGDIEIGTLVTEGSAVLASGDITVGTGSVITNTQLNSSAGNITLTGTTASGTSISAVKGTVTLNDSYASTTSGMEAQKVVVGSGSTLDVTVLGLTLSGTGKSNDEAMVVDGTVNVTDSSLTIKGSNSQLGIGYGADGAVMNVTNSTVDLSEGTTLHMGYNANTSNSVLNIKNSQFVGGSNNAWLGGGTINVTDNSTLSVCTGAEDHYNYRVLMGLSGNTVNLNVESGSDFVSSASQFVTNFNGGTTVNINVKGEGSTLVHNNEIESAPAHGITKTTTYLLDSGTDENGNKYGAVNNVKTNITASEGGSIAFNSDVTYVGSAQDKAAGYTDKKLNISVDSTSSMTFGDMVIYADTSIDNKGTFTVDDIAVHDGATVENLGSLSLDEVVLSDATLYNAGELAMNSLVMDNATLLFAATALDSCSTLIYNGADLTGYGISNVSAADMIQNFGVVMSGAAADGLLQQWGAEVEFSFTLAQGSELFEKEFAYVLEQNLAEFTITLGDVAELTVGADEIKDLKVEDTENGVVISGIAVIPEPTTATLSLLALAALAARRRRK